MLNLSPSFSLFLFLFEGSSVTSIGLKLVAIQPPNLALCILTLDLYKNYFYLL